jgi:hypothetical protein
MPSVVVDTCVVSYLFKGGTRAGQYRRHLARQYSGNLVHDVGRTLQMGA